MPATKAELIGSLGLTEHPEGGYYKRIYESTEKISLARGERFCSTAIHYLLESGGVSKLHRLKSDELWFHHQGKALTVVEVLVAAGGAVIKKTKVGNEPGALLVYNVPAGSLFGAYLESTEGEDSSNENFSLVSCVVSPGFDFADWEMPTHGEILALFGGSTTISEEDKRLLVKLSLPDSEKKAAE
jgi:uncharacterized protein